MYSTSCYHAAEPQACLCHHMKASEQTQLCPLPPPQMACPPLAIIFRGYPPLATDFSMSTEALTSRMTKLDRVSTLQSLDILDTEPEAKYDDITKLLCSIFNMPIAQLSLVDSDRQWCKSLHGHGNREIDRKLAFCAWVLLPKHPQALIVEDTLLDAR